MEDSHLDGTVMMKCDVLGTKFTRRYLLLQGSSLWVSKQTTLLDDKSYKQHLTGREEYLMVRLGPGSTIHCPPLPPNKSSPTSLILHVKGSLARDPSRHTTLALSFALPEHREIWVLSLEAAKQHLATVRDNGSYKLLLDIGARMRNSVPVMDRFYHLIRYRKCLLGSEAVLWLIHDQKCSQDQAISLGNQLIDLGLLYHVSHEHLLCHAYLFYRFNDLALAESECFQLAANSTALRLDNPTHLRKKIKRRDHLDTRQEGGEHADHQQGGEGCDAEASLEQELEKEREHGEDSVDEDFCDTEEEGAVHVHGASLSLLHAVEDLELENRALRGRLHAQAEAALRWQAESNQLLEEALAALEGGERGAVRSCRHGAVLLAIILVSAALRLIMSPVLAGVTVLNILGLEYCTQGPSRVLLGVAALLLAVCGLDACMVEVSRSVQLRERQRLEGQRARGLCQLESDDDTSLGSPSSTDTGPDNDDGPGGARISEQRSMPESSQEAEHGDDSANTSSGGAEQHSTANARLRIPPYSEWPDFPLLVRRSPDMFRLVCSEPGKETVLLQPQGGKFVGAVQEGEEGCNGKDGTAPPPPLLAALVRPVKIHGQPPETSIFPVDNHLFCGRVFVIVAGLEDSPADYFKNKNRLFQVVVQGRFKRPTSYASVYNGQIFKTPFRGLPPKWMIRILVELLAKIQPGLQVSIFGEQPFMVSSLIATSKNVVVSLPGSEPDICVTRKRGEEAVREDMSLLASTDGDSKDDDKEHEAAKAIFASRSATKRAHYFSAVENLSRCSFSPEHVYTFNFYQHVLNLAEMKIDLGFISLDVSSMIGLSPVQIMAVQWDPHSEPTDLGNVDYFYNIELWNQKSFPTDFFDNNESRPGE